MGEFKNRSNGAIGRISVETDYRFKFLYVIGIVSIIFGHSGSGISLFYDWFPPYSFHVPLFLFCSGYFYKEASADNAINYIVHKVKTLIIPLYLWNIFYGLFVTIISKFGFTFVGPMTLYNIVIAPITDGQQFFFNLGGWFVVPLFIIQVFNVIIRKVFASLQKRVNEWIYFVGYLILGLVGVYISNCGYNAGLGIILTRVLCMVPFYAFGILYKSNLEKRDNVPSLVYFSIIFIIQLLIITFNHGAITYSLSGCGNFPDNIFLPYIQSFVAIMFWLRIARILLPIIQDNKYIKLIGDSTYTIMINHLMGFFLVKTFFAVIHKYTVFCGDFSVGEFKNEYGYFYLPQGVTQWYLVYCIAGIVVPIVMQLCINKAKNILQDTMRGKTDNEK